MHFKRCVLNNNSNKNNNNLNISIQDRCVSFKRKNYNNNLVGSFHGLAKETDFKLRILENLAV